MDCSDIKIVFMGTPEFAVPVLRKLNENFNVICCVTKADSPKGRGNKLLQCEVKSEALSLGIPVLSPEKVKTPEFYAELSEYKADFFVTCAYGKILSKEILDMPKNGTVNVHASLLPKLRGANPIQRAIMDGETATGITTMLTDIGMDTGDMLLKDECEITPDMTFKELHDKLSAMGAELIVKTLKGLIEGTVKRIPQDDAKATFAPPLTRDQEIIDFGLDAEKVHNLIRSLDEKPGASAILDGKRFKLFKTVVKEASGDELPGTVIDSDKKSFTVKCGKNAITVFEIQPENSKRMDVRSYLNGHSISGRFC